MTRRSRWLAGVFAFLLLASAYLVFEFGRYQGGYSRLDHRRQAAEHARIQSTQAARIDELERELAILRTSREIDRETYSQLERTLAALETQLQTQEEELGFYRGIIQPPDGASGLRVQNVELLRDGVQRFVIKMVLLQAIAQSRRAAGEVTLRLAGVSDGEAVTFGLEEVSATGTAALDYDFRYFQGLEHALVLPEGFEPTSVELEIRPSQPRGEPLLETYDWAAIGDWGMED